MPRWAAPSKVSIVAIDLGSTVAIDLGSTVAIDLGSIGDLDAAVPCEFLGARQFRTYDCCGCVCACLLTRLRCRVFPLFAGSAPFVVLAWARAAMGNRRCRLSALGCLSRACCRRSKCAVRVSRFGVWCFIRRNWISRCFCAASPATQHSASDARQRNASQRRPRSTPPTRRIDPKPMGGSGVIQLSPPQHPRRTGVVLTENVLAVRCFGALPAPLAAMRRCNSGVAAAVVQLPPCG